MSVKNYKKKLTIRKYEKESSERENCFSGSAKKNKEDRTILFKKKWYRIPLAYVPKRRFNYIAFYQPVLFGR